MTPRSSFIFILSAVALTFAPAAVPEASAQRAGTEPGAKLAKHIQVMEKVLDEVLVDSPNLLVGSQSVTHGIYLDEFGVLFGFEAALLSHGRGDWWKQFNWSEFKVETKDGKTVIQFPSDEDEAENGKSKDKAEKKEPTAEDRYQGAKDELIGALLDYGETLAGLRDDQWVGIALFFDDKEEIGDREIGKVLIKAKVADLRAHGADRLTKKDMQGRIRIEEY